MYIKKNFFLIYLIIFFIFTQYINSLICSPFSSCKDCAYCGIDTKDYSTCNYYNAFCENLDNEISTEMRDQYYNYFRNDAEINNFCGEKDIKLEQNGKEISLTILNTGEKEFPKNKKMHCFYSIDAKSNKLKKIAISFEILQKNNNNIHKDLKFNITYIYYETRIFKRKVSYIYEKSDEEIRKEPFILSYINDYNIHIDFLDLNVNTNESLKITIKYNKEESDLIYVIFGFIALMILLSPFIYCCCYKKKRKKKNKGSLCSLI